MAMSNGGLTVLGFLIVFAILGSAELAKRVAGIDEETSRKLIHIGVGHWIIFALLIPSVAWAVVAPITFIVLNYVSYRRGTFGAMERTDSAGGLGTVYYSMSLALLVGWFFREGHARWIAVASMMVMAWGDGLAAVVGQRWGRREFVAWGGRKTVEGSGAMALASLVALAVCASISGAAISPVAIGLVAAVATGLEAVSPAGTDNLTVPLGTAGLLVAFS